MRILILNSAYIQNLIGGASRAVHEIAEKLTAEGCDVIVMAPKRARVDQNESLLVNYKLISFPYFNGVLRFINPIVAMIYYFRYIGFRRFDILWGNSPEPFLYLPKRAGRVIYTVHGPWLSESLYDGKTVLIPKLFYPLLFKRVDFLHFNSRYVRAATQKEYPLLSLKPFFIAPLLVDEQKFKNQNVELKLSKALKILLIRRLVPRTGVVEFLEAIGRLGNLNVQVDVVGTGTLEAKVSKLCDDDPRFVFHGATEQSVVDKMFSETDIVCMPTLGAEGFGISILEAVFRGKPVLHTGQGGMGDFLEKVPNCIKFTFDDLVTLSDAIDKYLDLKAQSKCSVELGDIPYSFNNSLKKVIDFEEY